VSGCPDIYLNNKIQVNNKRDWTNPFCLWLSIYNNKSRLLYLRGEKSTATSQVLHFTWHPHELTCGHRLSEKYNLKVPSFIQRRGRITNYLILVTTKRFNTTITLVFRWTHSDSVPSTSQPHNCFSKIRLSTAVTSHFQSLKWQISKTWSNTKFLRFRVSYPSYMSSLT
jgi:hypothetical protein